MTESGWNPDKFSRHSLRIGGASALSAGGTVSEGVIRREGRWKSGAYKVCTRNNMADISQIFSETRRHGNGVSEIPGQNTVWGTVIVSEGART